MIIGSLILTIDIPASSSLKEKRRVIKSIQSRLRNEFNVSVAEIDHQENRQSSVIAVVCVSSDQHYAHGLLIKAATWLENARLDCVLVDYEMEFI